MLAVHRRSSKRLLEAITLVFGLIRAISDRTLVFNRKLGLIAAALVPEMYLATLAYLGPEEMLGALYPNYSETGGKIWSGWAISKL